MGLLETIPKGDGTRISTFKLEPHSGHVLPEALFVDPHDQAGGVGLFKLSHFPGLILGAYSGGGQFSSHFCLSPLPDRVF